MQTEGPGRKEAGEQGVIPLAKMIFLLIDLARLA